MDMISKYADKLPGAGDPGVFDDLIKETEQTEKLSGNGTVKDNVGENADMIHERSGQLLGLMKKTNRMSYFVKDNEEVTGAVEKGNWLIGEINKILKKIANINCITKFCTLAKLLRKIEELKDELEEYIEKIKGFAKMITEKVKWIFNQINQK